MAVVNPPQAWLMRKVTYGSGKFWPERDVAGLLPTVTAPAVDKLVSGLFLRSSAPTTSTEPLPSSQV